MRLKPWQIAVGVLASALFLGVTPLTVYNATLVLLSRTCGWAWAAVRAVPLPLHPLRAAMLNVTADYDQLAHLVAEFLEQPTVDPSVRAQFLQFMSDRATRSYPRLEAALDWLLSIYKLLFPFLIISMATKLSGGGGGRQSPVAANYAEANGTAGVSAADDNTVVDDASGVQLTRLVSEPSGGWAAQAPPPIRPTVPLTMQEQRQMAISRAIARAAKGGGTAVPAGDRAGSLSPRGPETPVEGARLPAHPAAAQPGGTPAAATALPRLRQRAISSEILEGGL